MTYTAINIGPIIKTLGMARKPRELWVASYLFSYLMKSILGKLDKESIISPSPALLNTDEKNGIGLYPDRAYIKGLVTYDDIHPAVEEVAYTLGINEDFFNVMVVSVEFNNDAEAIKGLNVALDRLELYNIGADSISTNNVRDLIKSVNRHEEDKKEGKGYKLVNDAFDSTSFVVNSLGEIAAVELDSDTSWSDFRKAITSDDATENKKAYSYLTKEKDKKENKKENKNNLKSYHKYICIVQADGDNVGKAVSHPDLKDGEVEKISEALLNFGKDATTRIKNYGGLPIYAGGDDLLFIAPVVGHDKQNIFNLLEELDSESFRGVRDAIANSGLKVKDANNKEIPIKASLSFGVSITYYKYPLYEALESARGQLFEKAKNVKGKNAIVVDWRKHSGGAFHMEMSCADQQLQAAFKEMIEASSVEESVVSAVGHKIRENEGLFRLWIDQTDADSRNNYFFQKYLEYDPNKKEPYKYAALTLLNLLTEKYKEADVRKNEKETKEQKLTQTMYAMLRIAKFINGEEVKDE